MAKSRNKKKKKNVLIEKNDIFVHNELKYESWQIKYHIKSQGYSVISTLSILKKLYRYDTDLSKPSKRKVTYTTGLL